jgi:hypothetical protein
MFCPTKMIDVQEVLEAKDQMDRAYEWLIAIDDVWSGFEENYAKAWGQAYAQWAGAWERYHEVAGIPYDLND